VRRLNWALPGDRTAPVITAEGLIGGRHGIRSAKALPETCVIFEIGVALDCVEEAFDTEVLMERLPCFLDNPRCVAVRSAPSVCFTRGGYGAPAAVDTLEILRALGVKRVVVAGMCGIFARGINVGDVVIPHAVLSEEGTSRHYFSGMEFALPDRGLFERAQGHFGEPFRTSTDRTVTCDALYRQTFAKEALWRAKGCVGVDMESSALLAVASYYSMPAVSILLASDRHPLEAGESPWAWGHPDFGEARRRFVKHAALFALGL